LEPTQDSQGIGDEPKSVQKTLKEHILKPHKVDYWCGKSTDPEFEAKMLNVIGLYLNPDKNAMVLSVDEKTQIRPWTEVNRNYP
jgi:putative transposase